MGKLLPTIIICFMLIAWAHSQCAGFYEYGVNATSQGTIIDTHNALRLSLARGEVNDQPRACNMKRMIYSRILQREAQRVANTCTYKHDIPKSENQNLYISKSTAYSKGPHWEDAIQNWFSEHQYYHYPDDPNDATVHYTQVAWAKTIEVGCGYSNYLSDGVYKYRKLYVCNYRPGGNIEGEAPYKTVASNGQCGCEQLC